MSRALTAVGHEVVIVTSSARQVRAVAGHLVSVAALTGGSVAFGLSNPAMAVVGLLATRRPVPMAQEVLSEAGLGAPG